MVFWSKWMIKKAFDSLDDKFLISVSKNMDFVQTLSIEILMNQKSVIGGVTTHSFNLEQQACQGDSISAFLFILALEILLLLINAISFKRNSVRSFPSFYKEILLN